MVRTRSYYLAKARPGQVHNTRRPRVGDVPFLNLGAVTGAAVEIASTCTVCG
jgi:hypothetical protein